MIVEVENTLILYQLSMDELFLLWSDDIDNGFGHGTGSGKGNQYGTYIENENKYHLDEKGNEIGHGYGIGDGHGLGV